LAAEPIQKRELESANVLLPARGSRVCSLSAWEAENESQAWNAWGLGFDEKYVEDLAADLGRAAEFRGEGNVAS